jgi:quinol monooxygenase YgiN
MYAVTISMCALTEEGAGIVRQASLDIIEVSQGEEGCIFFDVLFDEKDPLLLRFYEAYESKEAFEAHLEAPHTKEWVKICMPYVDKSTIRMPESVSNHTNQFTPKNPPK